MKQIANSQMEKLFEVAWFELNFWARSRFAYIYFTIFLGCGFLIATLLGTLPKNVLAIFSDRGGNYINSPYFLMFLLTNLGVSGLLFAVGVFSQAACRDFDTKFANVLFSFPLKEWQYAIGRLFSAIVVMGFILSSIGLGYLIGEWMPWIDPERLIPFNGWGYVLPYLYLVIPNILIFGGFLFGVGLLTYQMLTVFLTGMALFFGNQVVGEILGGLNLPWLKSLLDLTGIAALTLDTQSWTSAQKAIDLVPLSSGILLNRLFWIGLSAGFVAWSLQKFRFFQWVEDPISSLPKEENPNHFSPHSTPQVYQFFGFATQLNHLGRQTLTEFRLLSGNPWFFITLTAASLSSVSVAFNSIETFYGTPNWPLSYLFIQAACHQFIPLFKLLIVFLAGEVIWRDRTANINAIADTLPVRSWVFLLSKFGALVLTVLSALLTLLISTTFTQAWLGYTHYEFGLSLNILFTLFLPELLVMCVLSLFIQVLVRHKYWGYFLAALLLFGFPLLKRFPQIPSVLVDGSFPQASYSQFDGFGATLAPLRWYQAYWSLGAVLLLTMAILFWPRGIETNAWWRWQTAIKRFSRPVQLVLFGVFVAFLGLGSWIFYNTRILNPMWSQKERETRSLDYEKQFKQFEATQPQVTAIRLKYELYPEQRRLVVEGRYALKNKTKKPIRTILLALPLNKGATIEKMTLAGVIQPSLAQNISGTLVQTFNLPKPILPGITTTLDFAIAWQPRGFKEDKQLLEIIANGTYIRGHLPQIGYLPSLEIQDLNLREKYRLTKSFAQLTLREQLIQANSTDTPELVNLSVIVGTSQEQIAVVTGNLQRQWIEGNRRYFEYKTSEPIVNLFPLYSARYQVKRDKWKTVNLEIYHLKNHEFNVERMMNAMKRSLDYFSTNFRPYPFNQVRIVEFPREGYTLSFPGTIGYSEEMGFLARINDKNPEAVDYLTYITAYEMARQWWGNQLLPAPDIKGQGIMNEALSQYSALMVMEKLYGREKVRHILKQELQAYLKSRSLHAEEDPLISTTESYISRRKGALAMYTLKDYIGESAINRALARYLRERSKYSKTVPPYPTVVDLVRYLRLATPPDKQYLIADLFETIVIYNNRAQEATYTKRPDGKYAVKLQMWVEKRRLDKKGNETIMPINEMMDIGVLGYDGKFLYLKKHPLKPGANTINILVNQEPNQAGIDPMNQLVNRNLGRNTIKVIRE